VSVLGKVADMESKPRLRVQRHLPRVCRTCHSPMARQEAACWTCGTQWASEEAPPARFAVIAGGLETDRWANEGGSVLAEAVARTG
jgi:hypothetical protein